MIEYPSTAEMAAVNTLEKELTNVTDLLDPTLAPGTVDLILGSDFAGLVPLAPGASPSPTVSASPSVQASGSPSPSPSVSVSGLAASNGGITAAAGCASDSSAFSGPLSP